MPANKLGLVHVSLRRLKVGQSTLIGPYAGANAVSAKIAQLRLKYPTVMGNREFTQTQMLLVDPKKTSTHKMYLVVRIK